MGRTLSERIEDSAFKAEGSKLVVCAPWPKKGNIQKQFETITKCTANVSQLSRCTLPGVLAKLLGRASARPQLPMPRWAAGHPYCVRTWNVTDWIDGFRQVGEVLLKPLI